MAVKPEPFYPLVGGSSKSGIYRISTIVKKDLGSRDDVERFKQWVEDNNGLCLYPDVIGYLDNDVYMRFFEGVRLCDDFSSMDLLSVINTIEKFSCIKKRGFDLDVHIKNLEANRIDHSEINGIIDVCVDKLKSIEPILKNNASFSHGDMILSNIIKNKNGLYYLDPRYFKGSSTYLWDYGKLRMSLMNYEYRFNIGDYDNSYYLNELDSILVSKDIYIPVLIITLMHICRLYRYKEEPQRETVIDMANEVLEQLERI